MKKIVITLQQLWDALDKNYTYIAVDKNGSVWAWVDEPKAMDDTWSGIMAGCCGSICNTRLFEIAEFVNKPWTECIAERPKKELDYLKWVGKLVVSWDEENNKHFGVLIGYDKESAFPFMVNDDSYNYARPATSEEVEKYLIEEER